MFTAIARGWNLRGACVVSGALCAASIQQSNVPHSAVDLRSECLQASSIASPCLTYTHKPSPIFSQRTGQGVYQWPPYTSSAHLASPASRPFYRNRPGGKLTVSQSLTWNTSIYAFGTLVQSSLSENKVQVRISSEKEVEQITTKRTREEALDGKKDYPNKAPRRQWFRSYKRPSDQKQDSRAVISADPVAVVFFHGLAQDKDYSKVWVNAAGEFWPQWLWESFPEANLLEISYSAYDRNVGSVNLKAFAEALLDGILSEKDPDEDREWWKVPTVLVGHGVGGIVIRALICAAVDRKERDPRSAIFLENVRGVVYYSTPAFPEDFDKGCLAKLSDAIYQKLGQSHVSSGDRIGKILSEILADCTSIRVVLDRFRRDIARKHLEQIRKGSNAMFETEKTKVQGKLHQRFKDIVVEEAVRMAEETEEYRNFHEVVHVDGRDHFTICKATNKEDDVYRVVHKLVKDILVSKPDE